MAMTSEFCRAQEALQRGRAAETSLDNVRLVATRAAVAWEREAIMAESREAKRERENALPEAASPSEDIEDLEDDIFSENPDRGLAPEPAVAKRAISPRAAFSFLRLNRKPSTL
jgi:hypothetical protein